MADFDGTIIETPVEYLGNRISIIRTFPASTPIEADLIKGRCEGVSPGIASVSVISAVRIKVNFENSAMDNSALRNPDNYVIDPFLAIHEVIPEGVTEPTYVELVIDEQKTGIAYTVTLQRIEAAV